MHDFEKTFLALYDPPKKILFFNRQRLQFRPLREHKFSHKSNIDDTFKMSKK